MSKIFNLITSLVLISVLQGCTSLSVGEPEFSCPGMPSGVRCMSAEDVYHNTNNGNNLIDNDISDQNSVNNDGNEGFERNSSTQHVDNDFIKRRFVEANLPYQPIPIRTPSMTMRIFISPYEDKTGDLLVPGLIYTDVEKRRWVVGEPRDHNKMNNTLTFEK